jgi:hypothetical protein
MPQLLTLPYPVPLSAVGTLLPGAKLSFFVSGSSTPQPVYQDINLTTPLSQPVEADAAGRFPAIYLDPALPDYRILLTDSADVVQPGYPIDDIPAQQNTAQKIRLKHTAPELIFEETDASANNKKWRLRVNTEALTVDIGNDAESAWVNVLSLDRNGVLYLADPDQIFDPAPLITGVPGSFTATLTGMDGSTTGTINYERIGRVVVMYTNGVAFTGTSNASSMTMTGLPSAIATANTHSCACYVTDNGVEFIPALATITGTTVTFRPLSGGTYSATGFTGSGTKGLGSGWSIVYPLTTSPA